MSDSISDMLNLLLFVVLLGVVVAVGFGSVMPLLRDDVSHYDKVLYDKTVPLLSGIGGKVDFDGNMSRKEIILMVQVQDYNMPAPKLLKVNNVTINIDSMYRYDIIDYGIQTYNELKNDSASARYRVVYDFGVKGVVGDESYRIDRKI